VDAAALDRAGGSSDYRGSFAVSCAALMRPNLAMQTKQLKWRFDDKTIELGCDWSGQGPKILFLPALSSISTRREMHPLQKLLSANYQTVVADWPGFGDQPRPSHDWQPVTYASFPDIPN
jgi:hypothetical protein